MQTSLIWAQPCRHIVWKELPPRPSLLNRFFQKTNFAHGGIIDDVKPISIAQPLLWCVHGRVEDEIVVDVVLHDCVSASETPLGNVLDPLAVFVERDGFELWEVD